MVRGRATGWASQGGRDFEGARKEVYIDPVIKVHRASLRDQSNIIV